MCLFFKPMLIAPDFAQDTFFDGLGRVKHSLTVHIYQITDTEICDKVLEMFNSGINVRLLVNADIYGEED